MKYIFKINVYTDGDFGLSFVPTGMIYDDDYSYELEKEYTDKESAIKDVLEICTFLKEQIHTSKDYVKRDWNICIENFIESINAESIKDDYIIDCIVECMYGNYSGTKFIFYTEEEILNIGFKVTDEELEMLQNYPNKLTEGEIKEVIFELIKKKNEE